MLLLLSADINNFGWQLVYTNLF